MILEVALGLGAVVLALRFAERAHRRHLAIVCERRGHDWQQHPLGWVCQRCRLFAFVRD